MPDLYCSILWPMPYIHHLPHAQPHGSQVTDLRTNWYRVIIPNTLIMHSSSGIVIHITIQFISRAIGTIASYT